MSAIRARRIDATARRGMLLLLVLSILALFIVIGAVGILLALRARESAVAFAAASANQAGSSALARSQLDAALLKLVRGPSAGAAALGRDVTESLLEDKYGPPQSCAVVALAGASSPVITATVVGLDLSNPTAVAGRVLTFVPAVGDPTAPTSYRVLGVNAAGNTLQLANVKPFTPLPLPTVFPCEAVLNGREFCDAGSSESYDAFDRPNDPPTSRKNPFLTVPGLDVVVVPSGSTTLVSGTLFTSGTFTIAGTSLTTGTYSLWPLLHGSTMRKVQLPAFGGTANAPCTVDNDGDGVPDGIWLDGVLPPQRSVGGGQLSFSVSYLVLDLDGRINLNAHGSLVRAQALQSAAQYLRDPATVPVGMGYGPADVDTARLVSPVEVQSGVALPTRYGVLLQGGTVTTSATASTATQWRPTPRVEPTQAGRYGSSVGPGDSTQPTATNFANADFWMLNPGGNSPTDLKARLQVFIDGAGPPTLRFCRPTGAAPWVSGTDTDDLVGSGTNAHPYALRLDEDARRAAGSAAIDALFTVGEFERILRPFDADAATLAPRLAAILDDFAERSRLTVTTESWDTPAITGDLSQTIASAVTAANPYAVLSPETVAGLRFNLNRPILGLALAPDRQAYFRQLYALCVALGASPQAAAQWAANVIEFRDRDSIMTWYPYDPNVLSGAWNPGTTGVWGAERPEMVIQAATKPDPDGNQVNVSLYRPWAAVCVSPSGSGFPTERIDGALGDATANTLDVTRMDVANTGTNAVWRLTAGGTTAGLDRLITTGTAVGTNADVPQATLTGNASPTEVVLQRLADPTRKRDADPSNPATYNDYVTIDAVSIPPVSPRGTPARWLHWPNRDLVSHGELLAVQSGSASTLAGVLFDGSQESSLARTSPTILDVTIVPSRFAGANVSVEDGAGLGGTGFDNLQYGHFSRWREAGRVNVNTILTNIANAQPALDNAVWTAVLGRTGVANPVGLMISGTPAQTARYNPMTRDRDLLVAEGEARLIRSGTEAASAFLGRSSAVRLANVATTRSHVFAVWITLRITDSSPNAGPPQFARLFAIVDRSIPVGYAPGRTLNVRETIRLQRFLQ